MVFWDRPRMPAEPQVWSSWYFVDPVEDPDDEHEPDLATADPVPDEPDPEGDI